MRAVDQIQAKDYKTALISITNSLRWPENLGSGKPYDEDIDVRLENYLDGICFEQTKDQTQATKKWNEIIAFKKSGNNVNTLISALALRKANRSDEGEKLLSGWVQKDPENKLARWCMEVYNGNRPEGDLEGDSNYRTIKALLLTKL